MKNTSCLFLALFAAVAGCQFHPSTNNTDAVVGPLRGGGDVVPTHQLVRPAGDSVQFGGRPVDLALSPDGRTLYVKDNRGLVVIDAASWKIRQELKFSTGGSSVHGLAVTRDGSRLFATSFSDILWEIKAGQQKLEPGRKLTLPGPGGKGSSAPCGLALSADEATAYVCLSRNNSLAVMDLVSGKVVKEIPVGVAPYDVVLSSDGRRAFVSNWGGRRANAGERTANSSGTATLVDDHGVASSGTVSVVDLNAGSEQGQIETGLHPCDVQLSPDGARLYVANANSDTVSVIDTRAFSTVESIPVRPDAELAFGSAPNAIALSRDGRKLFVANGGNNAVAVVSLVDHSSSGPSQVEGFIPTGWYPGAVLTDGKSLFVANVKGVGSRNPEQGKKGWNSHYHLGTVNRTPLPDPSTLRAQTRQVHQDARVPQMLRASDKSRSQGRPVPVPQKLGQPSVFEHVVYIIKENRTYDQVFGAIGKGNSDPALCVFGREVTPNHHALAEEFVLLDNYYCNGVCSADGHAWAMEGYATDYLEKSFGGWARSYPFAGDDPLSFAPTGFIWDHVLLHGLTFRNYGEMSKSQPLPSNAGYDEILQDYTNRASKIRFDHDIQIESLRRFSCPDSPGWQLKIPDMIRADVFLKEFEKAERSGQWPNLVILYLPSDHTSGTRPGNPTPRAQVADNDLALGRVVERISASRFWPSTCIFVNEDDPQNGFDHVDGHRSLCLVASPYTRRGAVVSRFYNQTSVLHTICRIFGLPPMNQMVALSPLMNDCFSNRPDLRAFTHRPNQVPLDEMNKPAAQLNPAERYWARKSLEQNFEDVDRADEDTLNRIIWHSVKGVEAPYPEQFAGPHGKGLRKLHLALFGGADEDDD